MSYDLYVELGGNSRQDVDDLVRGEHHKCSVQDIAARLQLLAGVACNASVKDYAVSGDKRHGGGYKSLVHNPHNAEQSPYAADLCRKLRKFTMLSSPMPPLELSPPGSWFLQFTFTLAKPWMSKDDEPFYVADSVNPVRKDKVFKVPTMAAASWKGLLRWTAMHTRLALKRDELLDEAFAAERLHQAQLFGDEKGEDPGQIKDFAAYVDSLKPSATEIYRRKVKESVLGAPNAEDMPHHAGRLRFYPTFFDLIDVEVINPHSRETKAGTHPIYLECVPAGAKGTFSLLYVPFDVIGKPKNEVTIRAKEDLVRTAEAIKEMFLTYGFSAKRTSGYGTTRDEIENGIVRTPADQQGWPLTRLSTITDEVQDVQF